ncbi:MAG: hypothetical protein Q7J09_11330 [Methanocalculus sp.]|uniref:hypothetical protein n=1 Tax=Methanocalculus sp. TaxID=2004547 RepID=UPI002722A4E9|nr:hypothetical protein [Methanocalculus sp.]MDO8842015.1 hypothetical protein [Methanocalculus sp.]MDO9540575.1 hypothetical protein [Methanocalculus sp.]
MKTLPFIRGPNDRITVQCATGEVPVHTRCAYCRHCHGIRVQKRLTPSPITQAYQKIQRGQASDQELLNAGLMFNTLVADARAEAIECGDEKGEGYCRITSL